MADRYWVTGGDGNWGSTNNWSTTSGGGGGSSVPGTGDNAFLDANSPNCTVNTGGTRNCLALNFTGYTNTITLNTTLNAYGSVTLSAGMQNSAGTGALLIAATGNTLTSNGKTWNNPLTIYQTTLADDWTVNGLVTINNATVSITINGFSLTCVSGLTSLATSGSCSGTMKFIVTGGTVTCGANGAIHNNIDFNGNITFATRLILGSGTYRWLGGTPTVNAGHLLYFTATGANINLSGVTWVDVTFGHLNGGTYTLAADIYMTGILTFGTLSSFNAWTMTGGTIHPSGTSIVLNSNSGGVSGTTIIEITNTTTITAPNATVPSTGIQLPFIVNAPGKTLTIDDTLTVRIGKWNVLAIGSIVTNDGANIWRFGTKLAPLMHGGFHRGGIL